MDIFEKPFIALLKFDEDCNLSSKIVLHHVGVFCGKSTHLHQRVIGEEVLSDPSVH